MSQAGIQSDMCWNIRIIAPFFFFFPPELWSCFGFDVIELNQRSKVWLKVHITACEHRQFFCTERFFVFFFFFCMVKNNRKGVMVSCDFCENSMVFEMWAHGKFINWKGDSNGRCVWHLLSATERRADRVHVGLRQTWNVVTDLRWWGYVFNPCHELFYRHFFFFFFFNNFIAQNLSFK